MLMHLLRHIDFRGKGLIVRQINPSCFQRIVVSECRGLAFELDTSDQLQFDIFMNIYERATLHKTLSLVPHGGVCIDAGANVGFYTLHFARQVGLAGKVYAFEPDPLNCIRLQRNIELNAFDTIVEVSEMALGRAEGEAEFYRSPGNSSGWGSLIHFGDIASTPTKVPVTMLDSFVGQKSLSHVDLLKIDVEASEFALLEGAKDSLARGIFKYVLIEFNGPRLSQTGYDFKSFVQCFESNRYFSLGLNEKIRKRIESKRVDERNICENFLFARSR